MGKIKSAACLPARQGFTLIEMLVASGVMVLFSITLIGLFLATVRGGTKAQVVQAVHQEGDYALKTMARMIRQSQGVTCTFSNTKANATNLDGGTTVFSIVTDNLVDKIASNSSEFLTGASGEVSALSFICYDGNNGKVVTISFTLTAGSETGSQAQEKLTQSFSTSVSVRND